MTDKKFDRVVVKAGQYYQGSTRTDSIEIGQRWQDTKVVFKRISVANPTREVSLHQINKRLRGEQVQLSGDSQPEVDEESEYMSM